MAGRDETLSEGVDERSSPGSSSDASGATTRFAPAPSLSASDLANRAHAMATEFGPTPRPGSSPALLLECAAALTALQRPR